MIGFLTVLHIIIAVALCALVLVQDSKGDGALGIGGGAGSNSLLGATGAQSLASKMTKWMAVFFAASCVALTYLLAHQNKSVVDQLGAATLTAPTTTESAPVANPGAEATSTKDAAKTETEKANSATSDKAPSTSGQPSSNEKN
ncbi:MAG: preprotein translocase subunit SecG [Bdellovibrionales bacterium]|nr:preprotein translocase subunit SecG [Bdellovibrionales bacterium]